MRSRRFDKKGGVRAHARASPRGSSRTLSSSQRYPAGSGRRARLHERACRGPSLQHAALGASTRGRPSAGLTSFGRASGEAERRSRGTTEIGAEGTRRGRRLQGQGGARRHHLDRQAAAYALLGRPPDRSLACVHRHRQPSHADRGVQRDPEEPLASLQPLRQRPDVLHAANHVVGRGDASGNRSQLSGLAWLHPASGSVRAPAMGHHQAGRPCHHRSRRGDAG